MCLFIILIALNVQADGAFPVAEVTVALVIFMLIAGVVVCLVIWRYVDL